jgi:DNA repair protein RadA/Sms
VYSERIDTGRVSRIAAVLEKHTGLRFSDQDLYVNVAGGMRLAEPGIDLALACALYSARSDAALPADAVLFGELSLAGELRPVRQMRRRAKAAAALGFSRIVGPSGEGGAEGGSQSGPASWEGCSNIKEALKALFRK